jgi:hypothetical protein
MNNEKLKRRKEKEENTIKKRSKSYTKRKNRKKLVPKGSAKLRWAGARNLIFHIASVVQWEKKPLTWAAQV